MGKSLIITKNMKIIINADDFGFTKGTNEAVFQLAQLGTLTSTTVMTNMPFAHEADKLLGFSGFSVGLHLNLTQGKPLLPGDKVPSLVGEDGNFHDLTTLTLRAKQGRLNAGEVEAEIEAQWNALCSIIGDRISHMDSHQGLNRIPFIFDRTLAFLKKQSVPAMRFYVKYYAVGAGEGSRIEKPGLMTIRRYGAKRLLVEAYLKRRLAQLLRHTTAPAGMLVIRSHDTRDLFRWLIEAAPVTINESTILEIPCHPAANTAGLVDTKYVEERVEEYELLKSSAFVEASKKWSFVDYSTVR